VASGQGFTLTNAPGSGGDIVIGNSYLNQDVSTNGSPTFQGVTLPTSGGTPAVFSYYEEISAPINYTGIWGTGVVYAGTVNIVRLGKFVSVSGTVAIHTATVAWFIDILGYTIPSRFRPSAGNGFHSIMIYDNGGSKNGLFFVALNSGGMQIFSTPGQSFSGTGTSGPLVWSAQWNILF
jgi:hypothetical protein